eukprot:COSAG06_NODE_8287_length_2215_cov_3.228261_3_plen_187_part_00
MHGCLMRNLHFMDGDPALERFHVDSLLKGAKFVCICHTWPSEYKRRKDYAPGHSLRAKVRRRLRNWWSAGAALEVLRWLREGVPMMWAGEEPARFHQGKSFRMSTPEEKAFVKQEVERLLESGAIREAEPGEATHISKAFLVALPAIACWAAVLRMADGFRHVNVSLWHSLETLNPRLRSDCLRIY